MSATTTAMQLRRFNYLQRPETDVRGLPNHWHFEVRPMPGVKSELVFIVNPHGRYFHGEGRTQISSLSIPNQAKVIVPLLLEAFVTEFDGMPAPVCRNSAAFAPFSWSTGNQALGRAVAARCQAIGIRSELCSVQVSDAQTIRVAGECWVRWEADIMQAMSMFGGRPDDGEENVEVEGGLRYDFLLLGRMSIFAYEGPQCDLRWRS
ncbi:unnamed protein product [Penicillium bialowiezense]